MTRTSIILTTVVALGLSSAAPVLANDQLAASAGLSPAEAQGMSLTEIAQYKFNRGVSHSDQQGVGIEPGSGGVTTQLSARVGAEPGTMSLNELTVAKYNAETRQDDRQGPASTTSVTVISRSFGGMSPARGQFIANAGLTPAEADGLTLNEIAAYKFNQGVSYSDWQAVAK